MSGWFIKSIASSSARIPITTSDCKQRNNHGAEQGARSEKAKTNITANTHTVPESHSFCGGSIPWKHRWPQGELLGFVSGLVVVAFLQGSEIAMRRSHGHTGEKLCSTIVTITIPIPLLHPSHSREFQTQFQDSILPSLTLGAIKSHSEENPVRQRNTRKPEQGRSLYRKSDPDPTEEES